jgi:hypothetical protein
MRGCKMRSSRLRACTTHVTAVVMHALLLQLSMGQRQGLPDLSLRGDGMPAQGRGQDARLLIGVRQACMQTCVHLRPWANA